MSILDKFVVPLIGGSHKSWITRYGAPMILLTVGLLAVVWFAAPMRPSELTDYQIETFIDGHSGLQFNSTASSEHELDNDESLVELSQAPPEPSTLPFSRNASGLAELSLAAPAPSPIPFVTDASGLTEVLQAAPTPSLLPLATNASGQTSGDTSGTEIVEDANLLIVADLVDGLDAASPGPHPVVEVEQEEDEDEEKFIVPLLSYQVGAGNQLMEYKSAAVIARTLNRTLCLAPFFAGPVRHLGKFGDRNAGLYVEDRYDTDVLSRFVKVASMEECLQKCGKKLDAHWKMKLSRPPAWSQWFNDTPKTSVVFKNSRSKWTSTEDILKNMGPHNDGPKCVGLGGLFPGLIWRGVYFAGSAYLQHSKGVIRASDLLHRQAFGENPDRHLSVHWRFEESFCRGHQKGLCFSRCGDGSVIANAQHSLRWENMTREGPKFGTKNGFNGVFVDRADVSAGIFEKAKLHELKNVYLSTDGWMSSRGFESRDIVQWVVEDLRKKGLNVAGLWQIPGVPNFSDGTFVEASTLSNLFGLAKTERVSNHMVSQVDQEMCERSTVFLGSGQSTWSLAVSYTRRGRRCQLELDNKIRREEELKGDDHPVDSVAVDNKVIDTILTVQYKINSVCLGGHDPSLPIRDDELDEAPDGWLDYEACEGQLDRGSGHCTRITQ